MTMKVLVFVSPCLQLFLSCFPTHYPSDLKKKFSALLKDHSPDRQLYCHFTSVTVRYLVLVYCYFS
jgi:hypothetical protein